MKKKVLCSLLVAAMGASLLAGCGSKDKDTQAQADNTITIWVADNVVDFTEEQVKAFQEANKDYADYKIVIEPVGEGEAAGNMITDVKGGADIYGFAQDQLSRLVSAGALMPVIDTYASDVTSANDEGSVAAAKVGDVLYAYPMTSDNGYFLYYDSSVISDPTTLEGMLAECEAAGKYYYQDLSSWYQTAFFFGNGCTLEYTTDAEGNFTDSNIDYANEKGVQALKAMINMHKSSAYVKGSSVADAADAAAVVSGTWDYGAAQEKFGDNLACAKLPTVTVDGTTFQLGGFSGFKLLGVKPQEDAKKMAACQAIANFLTSEETQLARFDAVAWGPSNKNAQANDAVASNIALAALAEQIGQADVVIPQGQFPGDYWGTADALGDDVNAGTFDNYSDEELLATLQTMQDTLEGLAK